MIKFLFWLNIVLQILDGVLTYVGVTYLGHGTFAEGNLLLRYCMDTVGIIPALLFFKGFGILALILVLKISIERLQRIWYTCVAVIYIFVAVIPWLYVLSQHTF